MPVNEALSAGRVLVAGRKEAPDDPIDPFEDRLVERDGDEEVCWDHAKDMADQGKPVTFREKGSAPSGKLLLELVDDWKKARGWWLADGERQPKVLDREMLDRTLHLSPDRVNVVITALDWCCGAFVEVGAEPRGHPKQPKELVHGGNVVTVGVAENDDVIRVE